MVGLSFRPASQAYFAAGAAWRADHRGRLRWQYNDERPVRHEVAPHEWNRDRNVSKPRLVSKPVPNLHMHSWQQECVKLEVTPKKASSQKMQSGKGKSGRVNANEPLLRSRYRGDAANG